MARRTTFRRPRVTVFDIPARATKPPIFRKNGSSREEISHRPENRPRRRAGDQSGLLGRATPGSSAAAGRACGVMPRSSATAGRRAP